MRAWSCKENEHWNTRILSKANLLLLEGVASIPGKSTPNKTKERHFLSLMQVVPVSVFYPHWLESTAQSKLVLIGYFKQEGCRLQLWEGQETCLQSGLLGVKGTFPNKEQDTGWDWPEKLFIERVTRSRQV